MAKQTSNYKASATEFGKRLSELYKLKFFPRMGKEFADQLYASGVEAGAKISALSYISDAENKIRVASDAIVKLSQTAFALEMLVNGGYYTQEQTASLSEYIEKLIAALKGLVSSVKVHREGGERVKRAAPVERQIVVKQQPVVKRKVIFHSADGSVKTKIADEEVAAKPTVSEKDIVISDDDDGFNAPYNKKI